MGKGWNLVGWNPDQHLTCGGREEPAETEK